MSQVPTIEMERMISANTTRDVSYDPARNAMLAVNGAGIVAAAAFATTGLVRPNYARPDASASSLARFWSAASAVRTWSLAAPLLVALVRERRLAPELLTVAGLVQLGDGALGVWQRNPRMAALPAAMGLVHLRSARVLSASLRGSNDLPGVTTHTSSPNQ